MSKETGRQNDANGRELTCGIYLTQTGYEVRAEYSDREVLRTQWAMDTQGGRAITARVNPHTPWSRGHALFALILS